MATVLVFFSRCILSFGKIGVSDSNGGLLIAHTGSLPLTDSRYNKAENLSLCDFALLGPLIISPVFKLNLLICDGETYTSSSPGR